LELLAGRTERPVTGAALAPPLGLPAFSFGAAAFAFGLTVLPLALSAFFPALPFSALAASGFAEGRPSADLAGADRAALGAEGVAAFALLPAAFDLMAPEVRPSAGIVPLPLLAGVVLAASVATALRAVVRGGALPVLGLPALGLPVPVLAGVASTPLVLAGAWARALAASLSDVTAVSRALVAAEIAVSALVSVFADEAALAAAAFSLFEAVVTFVAAVATVRGVGANAARTALPALAFAGFGSRVVAGVLLATVRAAELAEFLAPVFAGFVVPVVFVVPAVFGVPAVFTVLAVFVAPTAFEPPAGFAVRVTELVRAELAIRTGAAFFSAALFVAATDLPPIWTR
jgi:hypothetical protein